MALARNSDPNSSHAAATNFEASGAGLSHAERCLKVLAQHPSGMTAKEIEAALQGANLSTVAGTPQGAAGIHDQRRRAERRADLAGGDQADHAARTL